MSRPLWRTAARRALTAAPAVADLAEFMRSPRHATAILRDLRETRVEAAFLRELPRAPAGARRVLIPSLFDAIYTTKLELMLATGLRMRGWHATLLVRTRYHRTPQRYAQAFGLTDIAAYDDFPATERELRVAEEHAASLLRGDFSFPTLKQWQFEESWVGPQILSTVSRASLQGAPDPADPEIHALIRELLPTTLAGVFRARRVLDALKPDLLLVNEANYATYGVLVDVATARGIDVVQVAQPWRDDALMCRRLTKQTRREHPASLSRRSLDRLDEQPWGQPEEEALGRHMDDRYGDRWFLQGRNQADTRRLGREELTRLLHIPPERPIAVVFSHVLWDANLFYGDDLFDDYGDWLVQTVRAAADNARVTWLVKLHPANLWKRAYQGAVGEYSELRLLREKVGPLPDHVRVLPPETDVSTLSLYSDVEFGVTVRGTAGMEMACFGKPVLTAGTGRYSGLGFTIDSQSREEYLSRLAMLPEHEPVGEEHVRRAKRHALAVFGARHWEMRSFRSVFTPTGGKGQPLDHNLRFVARSADEMTRLGDLDAWANWAGDTDEVDFLQPTTAATPSVETTQWEEGHD